MLAGVPIVRGQSVSILVLVEVSFRRQPVVSGACERSDVSILVLVEVSFRLEPPSRLVCSVSCFNPCFSGSLFPTSWHPGRSGQSGHVSILVLVEVSFRLGAVFQCVPRLRVSILVLVEVSFRRRPTPWWQRSGRVSILVLVEVSFRRHKYFVRIPTGLGFQSLF